MPDPLAALQAQIDDLRSKVERPKIRRDPRPNVNFRLNKDEIAAIDAACLAQGICRSDMIRLGLNAVLGMALPTHRDTPSGLRQFVKRLKPDQFSDGKTDTRDRDRATLRQALARRTALIDADSALTPRPQVAKGMMSEPTGARSTSKLGRP